jgi:hypothetical protein
MLIRTIRSICARPKEVILVVAILSLTACTHVPLATMVKLSNFDMLKTDPVRLRVAIRYPDSIKIPDGGATMLLTVKMKAGGAKLLEEEIEFEEVDSKLEKAELASELKQGTRIGIYRIQEENTPFFKSFQKLILSKSEVERDKLEGNMSISVSGCKISEQLPEKIHVSTFLKTEELGSYVPLLRDVDLKEVMANRENPGLELCKVAEITRLNQLPY